MFCRGVVSLLNLVSAVNAILPWKHRFRWLLDSGWHCNFNSIAVSPHIYWSNPDLDMYSSYQLFIMPAAKFRKLVSRTNVWYLKERRHDIT